MPRDEFKDRVVVVTGGSSGIGAAVVESLIARGAHVAALSRSEAPGATLWQPCDVTDAQEVQRAIDLVVRELGEVRHLVCSAAVVSEAPIEELSPDDFRLVVEVALNGTFHAARAVVPSMRRAGAGSIVAYSSGYGTMGYRHGGHYAAAKAGVEALAKSLARELAPTVRVNVVAPGPVETPMLDHIEDQDTWRADRLTRIPMGWIASPADIVGPTLFMLSDAAGYITGQVLHVNGGLLMP